MKADIDKNGKVTVGLCHKTVPSKGRKAETTSQKQQNVVIIPKEAEGSVRVGICLSVF